MTVTEHKRRHLHQSLVTHIGEAEADTMMDLLPTVEWTEIATKRDLEAVRVDVTSELVAFRTETTDRFARLEARMGGFEERMARLEERMTRFEERLNSLVPKLIVTSIGIATGFAGLIFAASKLAGI